METTNKRQINLNWEFLSFITICVLGFLLPIFVLPSQVLSFSLPKVFLAYFGIILAFVFWLINCLKKGEVKIPKSFLLLAGFAMVIVWLASAVFSDNIYLSLIGRGYEIGTFSFFLFLFLAFFIISSAFQSEKRGMIFYVFVFAAAVIVFIFQLLHTLFNINIIPFDIFPAVTSNLIGGWNDFSIFFGFIGLTSLVFLELSSSKKLVKTGLFLILVISLLSMMAVNFYANWLVFGFFTLTIFLYIFSKSFFASHSEVEISVVPDETGETSVRKRGGYNLVHISFFIFLIVFFFILVRSVNVNFNTFLKTDFIEVRPSWSATWDVVKQVLTEKPFLGSGPNTFLYDWLKFKPLAVNNTVFWNARFLSGIAHLPSMLATTGIIGGLALLVFLIILISSATKALYNSSYQGDITQALLIVSFLGSLYLWFFTIIYSPGFLIFALAFFNTGILIAMLVRVDKIKNKTFSFLDSPKTGFIAVLLTAVFFLGSIASFYIFIQNPQKD